MNQCNFNEHFKWFVTLLITHPLLNSFASNRARRRKEFKSIEDISRYRLAANWLHEGLQKFKSSAAG